MDKLLFIGALNRKGIAQCGETIKNQLLYERLSELFPNIEYIDTYEWKKNPRLLFQLLLLPFAKRKIVISTSTFSAYKLIRFLYYFAPHLEIFYFVIGGAFHKYVYENRISLKYYQKLKAIIVEGNKMKEALSVKNPNLLLYVLPNFKHVIKIEKSNKAKNSFVFLSRINKEKGVLEILESVKRLNTLNPNIVFNIDFYGRIDESFKTEFLREINTLPNVEYKGFLDLNDSKGYIRLSQYEVMLFPTYWSGEGFPGVVVDSFIAGVPAIVSKWGLNEDLVEENITGLFVEAKNVEDLTTKINSILNNEFEVHKMSENCKKEGVKYDVHSVLSAANLKKIGLLD